MSKPIRALLFSEPEVIFLNLSDETFSRNIQSVRLLLRSMHDSSIGIFSESVFELGLIRVLVEAGGIDWKIDFHLIWPRPLMDTSPGELKLINWYATGGNKPNAADFARKKAVKSLENKIATLIQSDQNLQGVIALLP